MIRLRLHIARLAVALCCAGGILAWGGIFTVWRHTELMAQDWIVYYAAGTAALSGKLALLFDAARFTQYQYATLGPWFTAAPSLHPWLYPPHYLLFILPFCLLPFAASYVLFLALTGAAAVAALAWRGAAGGMDWPRGLMLLFFPASCIDALTGQNAFLSTALLIGGFRFVDRQPVLAGIALGALSYKPQLWLLVPVALIAARAWFPLAIAVATATLLVLASAALFGVESWQLWIDQTLRARDPAFAAWFAETFLRGYSVYVAAALLGAPPIIASDLQIAAAVAAAAAVYVAYRRSPSEDLRIAVLLAATMLAAPHLQAYDMVLLAAAVILLFARAIPPFAAIALFGVVWALPLLRPFLVPDGRFIVPAALAALLAYAVAATRSPVIDRG
jgi:alpha-1,2-mannosyltransferase